MINQAAPKAAFQARVAATLTQFLVPMTLAGGAGIATNAWMPQWVSPWAVALLVLTTVTLFYAGRSQLVVGKMKLGAVLWTIVSLALSCGAGYFEWQRLAWPISPWLGAGAIGALWVIIFIWQVFVRGKKKQVAAQTTDAFGVPAAGKNAATNLSVTNTLLAQLGLPIGQTTVDMAALVNTMARQAESNYTQANAALMQAALEAVRQGVIKPEQLTERACMMLGINLPKTPVQPEPTQSKVLPRRQAVTIDWGRPKQKVR